MYNTLHPVATTLLCRGQLLDLQSPVVMGIINLTTDSFYGGSRYATTEDAVEKAGIMLAEGAAIIDIGGQSTRPGAVESGAEAEIAAVVPAIQAILGQYPQAIISIDTFHASVAEAALMAGAHIINDVSGGQRESSIWDVAARYGAPYILMHMRGTPATMQQMTDYGDIVADLLDYFTGQVSACRAAGVKDIILDPGFGFSKTIAQNHTLLSRIGELRCLGLPLLAGLSRKSMLYKPLGITAEEALNATTAAHVLALQQGASILRVHDVREAVECVRLKQMATAQLS